MCQGRGPPRGQEAASLGTGGRAVRRDQSPGALALAAVLGPLSTAHHEKVHGWDILETE